MADQNAPSSFPWKRRVPLSPSSARPALLGLLILGALLFLPIFIWFFCRIEPGPGQIAVLIKKTGDDLPSGQILATEPGQKGIQLDVLPEGRYFRNPIFWDWHISRITDIPAGKLGVQVRLFGRELPPGAIIANEGEKGILADVLRPGKYRVNPYAYMVELYDAISIKPGAVGVETSLIGADVLNSTLSPEQRNTLLVDPEKKGVVERVLDPGTYYLNPYLVNIVEVNLQSQRFEMSGDDAISFLTMDGFNVNVEGTIEFGINREKAAELTHRVGDLDDILKKVVLPRARGFSRIEGSKHPAIDFIVGETRQQFQNSLDQHLREKCADWGVGIKSVLIRNIQPPDEIASVIRDREVAVQNSLKFDQQIEQARSRAELVKQEMLAQQNKEKVEADTVRIRAVILAQQDQAVRLTAAQQELEVARLENEAAAFQAQAIVSKAKADGDVIRLNNEATAKVFENQIRTFGTGMLFARYNFYQKIAPRISSILSSDDKNGLGAAFLPFLPDGKGVTP